MFPRQGPATSHSSSFRMTAGAAVTRPIATVSEMNSIACSMLSLPFDSSAEWPSSRLQRGKGHDPQTSLLHLCCLYILTVKEQCQTLDEVHCTRHRGLYLVTMIGITFMVLRLYCMAPDCACGAVNPFQSLSVPRHQGQAQDSSVYP